jgi:WD40 repeat protein
VSGIWITIVFECPVYKLSLLHHKFGVSVNIFPFLATLSNMLKTKMLAQFQRVCKKFQVLSSSCDGSVRLWNFAEKRCVEKWSKLWKESNDVTASVTRGLVSWNLSSVSKNEFAIPVGNAVRVFVSGGNEEFKEEQFLASCVDGEILSTTSWSFDGKFLSAGSSKGCVFVWKKSDKSLVATLQSARQNEIW